MTQRQIILRVLEEASGAWIPSYSLLKMNTKWGWLGSSADRFLRRGKGFGENFVFKEWGKIYEVEKKREGKYVHYRLKQPPHFPQPQGTIVELETGERVYII